MHIPGLEQNVILVDSVSKRYNLCGARVGCIVSHNKEVMAAALKYAQARLCPPVLGQIAAIGALDTPDSYIQAVREEYVGAVQKGRRVVHTGFEATQFSPIGRL